MSSAGRHATRYPRGSRGAAICLAVLLAAAAHAENVALPRGMLSNTAWGTALDRLPPVPPGFRSQRAAARALRKGKVERVATIDETPSAIFVDRDVEYTRANNSPLLLDIYLPHARHGPAPLLVFVHGGAWDHGDKTGCAHWAGRFAARGYVCASLDYRLIPVAPFPAALDDVRAALRFLCERATAYGIDTERIGLIGFSAGAHLALLAAYEPSGDGPRVQAVVDFYGPPDLTDHTVRRNDAVRRLLGGERYRAAPDRYRAASPLTYVSGDGPPTLIVHGTVDSRVPVAQSDRLAAALAKARVPYLYDRQPGWHHAMDEVAIAFARCEAVTAVFLDRYLPATP